MSGTLAVVHLVISAEIVQKPAPDDARASTTPALGRSHRPGEAIVISEVNPARVRERW
jgi:hypothetical protein